MRILGLDVGDKRIGVAVSDMTGRIASALTTIERQNTYVIEELKALSDKYNISEIVVGIPLKIDATEGDQAKKVRQLIARMKKEIDLPFKEWDERLTSSQAERNLISGNARRAKRKAIIDRVAAALILQSYLDNLNRKT